MAGLARDNQSCDTTMCGGDRLCAIAELLSLPFPVFLQPLCITFALQGCFGLIHLTLE
ncbi:hypothetical protein [Novosphingobium arvoryzae]|uniref:hypothetical protein n=1 Tax=Novosphingobium arvoryzae TaxID=1256514 RepID=UPI0016734F99|nr:hypothetical protein [Novosphingobium arvoryzae]